MRKDGLSAANWVVTAQEFNFSSPILGVKRVDLEILDVYVDRIEIREVAFRSVAGTTSISKTTPTVTVNPGSYTYNGSFQGPGVEQVSKGGSTGAVTLQYGGNAFGGAVYGPTDTPPTDAGNYTVVATVAEDTNYNQASSSPTAFTIAKANYAIGGGHGHRDPVRAGPGPIQHHRNRDDGRGRHCARTFCL